MYNNRGAGGILFKLQTLRETTHQWRGWRRTEEPCSFKHLAGQKEQECWHNDSASGLGRKFWEALCPNVRRLLTTSHLTKTFRTWWMRLSLTESPGDELWDYLPLVGSCVFSVLRRMKETWFNTLQTGWPFTWMSILTRGSRVKEDGWVFKSVTQNKSLFKMKWDSCQPHYHNEYAE